MEKSFGHKPFSWGSLSSTDAHTTRKKYIDAIRMADKGDFSVLMAFATS